MRHFYLSTIPPAALAALCVAASAEQPVNKPTIILDTLIVDAGSGALPKPMKAMALQPLYAGGQIAQGNQLGILGNRDIMSTPFNVTGYTAQLIENTQAHSIADVVANDPSVRVIFPQSSYRDVFTVRGFNLFSYNIGLDGLYGVAPKQRYPVEFAERIEVLKGPDTFVNGVSLGGSVGGAINIVPKRAPDAPVTAVTLNYGSQTDFGTHLDFARRYGTDSAFGLRFNGLLRDGDLPVNDQSERLGAMALNVDYQGETFRFYGSFGTQQQKINAPDWAAMPAKDTITIPVPSARTSLSQDWAYIRSKDTYGSIRAEYDLSDDWTLFGTLGASTTETTGLYVQPTELKSNGDFIASIASFPSSGIHYSGQTGLRGQFDTGPMEHNLTFAYARWDQNLKALRTSPKGSGLPSNIDVPVSIPKPDTSFIIDLDNIHKTARHGYSSFVVTDTISIFDERLLLTLGGRWQNIRNRNFDAYTGLAKSDYDHSRFSPAAGILIKFDGNVSLYGNYVEALQQGTTAPATAVNDGETFAPVIARQIETGVKLDSGDWMTSLSLFQITQPSGITDPTSRIYSQDGEQRNRGVEFNIAGEPLSGFRLLGGVTLFEGKLTKTTGGQYDGNKAIGVPNYQINLGAEWDTPFLEALTLSARMINTGRQFADAGNQQQLDAWTRFDIGARYVLTRPAAKPVTFRFAVENLFNGSYWSSASSGQVSGLSRGAPRTFLVSTKFEF